MRALLGLVLAAGGVGLVLAAGVMREQPWQLGVLLGVVAAGAGVALIYEREEAMRSYVVRLTVEGEHEEQTFLARDSLHAMRQALEHWHFLEPLGAVVLTCRELAIDHELAEQLGTVDPPDAPRFPALAVTP